MCIPPIAHFVWFGDTFPWLNWLAVRSAADRGEYAQVIVHHEGRLEGEPYFDALTEHPRVTCRPLAFASLLDTVSEVAPGLEKVAELVGDQPAMKSDMARIALLWVHGGVYLDVDTVSLAPLNDLMCSCAFFCGSERIVWPAAVRSNRSPIVFGAAVLRSMVRDFLRRRQYGWKYFRVIETHYPAAVNNAVMGSTAGHPVVAEALRRAGSLRPEHIRRSPYAVGPDLLQGLLAEEAREDVCILPPEWFFPLGPEISEHWFRVHSPGRRPALDEVLFPETRVVHWYGSVRAREAMRVFSPEHVRAYRDRQLLAELAAPWA